MSVLENYHIAMTFEILSKSDYNIFSDLEKSDYKRVRKTMIGAVLATDMSMHFNKIGILKGKLTATELEPTQEAEKRFICEQIFHLCDIANSTKDFTLCEKWTQLLFDEFYVQGDNEKRMNVPVSQFMDRCTTNIAKSQIGFINFII